MKFKINDRVKVTSRTMFKEMIGTVSNIDENMLDAEVVYIVKFSPTLTMSFLDSELELVHRDNTFYVGQTGSVGTLGDYENK